MNLVTCDEMYHFTCILLIFSTLKIPLIFIYNQNIIPTFQGEIKRPDTGHSMGSIRGTVMMVIVEHIFLL